MMPNRRLAEKAVALKMCEKLYAIGETFFKECIVFLCILGYTNVLRCWCVYIIHYLVCYGLIHEVVVMCQVLILYDTLCCMLGYCKYFHQLAHSMNRQIICSNIKVSMTLDNHCII